MYLVWDDGRLVDNDVEEPEDVRPVPEVEQQRRVPVHEAALRQHLDRQLVHHRRDLCTARANPERLWPVLFTGISETIPGTFGCR
jgi:hypothetical protein